MNLVHSAEFAVRSACSSNGEVSIHLCSCSAVPSPVQAGENELQLRCIFSFLIPAKDDLY